MDENLDIIPIHVIADSENKAEMLNGLLRAQGLAVKPVWSNRLEDWQGSTAELVFYFADTEKPTLAEVVQHAERHGAPLIVIARERNPGEAARALAAGAADWIRAEHNELLAAVARRERAKRHTIRRLHQLERASERDRELLKKQFRSSQDAIATFQDGIVVEANAACAECFGHADPPALVGLPLMDLFAPASRPRLKQGIKAAYKTGASQEVLNLILRRADGSEHEAKVAFNAIESNGERQAQMVIRESNTDNASILRVEELETENERLKKQADSLQQNEAGSGLLWPGSFAPAAAERISHVFSGSAQALVAIRPANPEEALNAFGPLGLAEAGKTLATLLSPLLETRDLATRLDGLCALALINRSDETAVKHWAEAAIEALGRHVFEGAGRSSQLDFVAGYAPVDRTRKLDPLIRQALEAAKGSPGTVSRSENETLVMEADDDSWAAFIREALDEHRYTVSLRPIEDLSSGTRLYGALPRLLDRDGREIAEESFYPPAERLGLMPILEQRLAGHALRATLHLERDNAVPRMIVPLRAETLMEARFSDFLLGLIARTQKRLPSKSLILELAIEEISGRMRDIEQLRARVERLDCAIGLRGYAPNAAADKLLERVAPDTVRMAENVMERLEEDETLAPAIQAMTERLEKRGTLVIATGVGDPNMMATLYNLGIGTVEGPVIGEAELFRPAKGDLP